MTALLIVSEIVTACVSMNVDVFFSLCEYSSTNSDQLLPELQGKLLAARGKRIHMGQETCISFIRQQVVFSTLSNIKTKKQSLLCKRGDSYSVWILSISGP